MLLYLVPNRPKTMSHIIYLPEKIHLQFPLPTSKNWIAWLYHIYKIAYNLSIYPCIQMRTFFWNFTLKISMRIMHTGTKIENQLCLFEYFYDKIIYMNIFCLGFVKVLSTYYLLIFWFFAQMQKNLNEKDHASILRLLRHFESCHMATSKSSLFPGLFNLL